MVLRWAILHDLYLGIISERWIEEYQEGKNQGVNNNFGGSISPRVK